MSSKNTPSSNDNDSLEQELYQKRKKLYVREVHGLFANLRNLAMVALLGLYYGIPWLNWDGHQSILFDLPERKFYIFSLVFWPQDFIYLSALLIIAALALFMFTALAGRLWCGYACPQTVWTEIYMWMERKIEGGAIKQKKLDDAPRNFRFYRIKATKHFVWIVFSIWTGFTFVGYFTPIRELTDSFIAWQLGPWETFWIFFYGFATYGNAGWLREQVCIYMCPYARFQSAMIDKNSLIISYDEERGESRGPRKKGVKSADIGKGDCIDCKLCVKVCPVGIDIRDGLQYQCIGCAACVDVCDEVMDKVGYERGLVKYTTENAMEGHGTKILRPRIFVYIGVIGVVTAMLVVALLTRVPLEVDIIRDRSNLFTENRYGLIENVYNLKVINMDKDTHTYSIKVDGLEGLKIQGEKNPTITVESGAVADVPLRVEVDPEDLKGRGNDIYFTITSQSNPELTLREHGRFLGPVPR